MVKFLLGCAIVAFASAFGRLLAKKYRQRKLFFKQLREFNERFLSEIAYERRPLKAFLNAYSYQGEFAQLLRGYYAALEEDAPAGASVCEEISFLSEEEKRTVDDYFLMLGRGDSVAQRGYFSAAKERLVAMQTTAEVEEKRYGDLYVKLGFLCGLLILILIV